MDRTREFWAGISINSSSNQQVHADGDVGQGETVLDPTSELRFTWKPRVAGGNGGEEEVLTPVGVPGEKYEMRNSQHFSQ